ncbi:hypothetical protein D3C85_1084450 [compost metagenome]
MFAHRAMGTLHRVLLGKRQGVDALLLRSARRFTANVGVLARRVGADHQEVVARIQVAVTGAGRQQQHIPGTDFQHQAIGPAQHQACMPAGHPKHFMAFGMVVVVVVHAVAPLRWPAIGVENLLEQCGRVAALDGNGLGVNEHRQARVVGDPAVALEQQRLYGSRYSLRIGHWETSRTWQCQRGEVVTNEACFL